MRECSKSIAAETVTSNSFQVFLLKMTEYIDKAKMGGSYIHMQAKKPPQQNLMGWHFVTTMVN